MNEMDALRPNSKALDCDVQRAVQRRLKAVRWNEGFGVTQEERMNFHGQMMNLQPPAGFDHDTTPNERVGYARGHRDARHAAAEVALKADSVRDAAAGLLAHLEAVNCWTREEEPYMDALREALTPNVAHNRLAEGKSG